VAEAKARLSELIEAALDGEDVVIARRNKPLVKLIAVRSGPQAPVRGVLKGRVWMSADFDEPLEDFAEYMTPLKKQRKRGRRA
jgi:prevent-host-death family protein